jgi:hypothetical protein
MSGEGFILDQPHEIRAFVYLQVYFKMKMIVEHPDGPRWRLSPLKQAVVILKKHNVEIGKKTYNNVFPIYKTFLIENGILNERT